MSWQRVTKDKPCPVCGKPNWCCVSENAVYCMRVESDRPSKSDCGGWIHAADSPVAVLEAPRRVSVSDSTLHAKWHPQVSSWCFSPKHAELANVLGVAAWTLKALNVGWADVRGWCWTWPERNALGEVVGVNRRFESDGVKRCIHGSRRGLYYVDGWMHGMNPVVLVEGGSDTAAALTMGLSVIGRPSNVGGIRYLAQLLRGFPGEIVVLGENDHRDDVTGPHLLGCRCCPMCWPGKFGAVQAAKRLSSRLDRRVEWALPPDGAKDLRGWLNARDASPEDREAMRRLGVWFMRSIRS